jgi:hypothetical protein
MASSIDAHFYRLHLEWFPDATLENAPTSGANVEDRLASAQAFEVIVRAVESGDLVRLADTTGSF